MDTENPFRGYKISDLVSKYVHNREIMRKAKQTYEAAIAPLEERKNLLEGAMLEFLDTTGQSNAATDNGTVYRRTQRSASLADPAVFMNFVITNQKFELLDRKANVKAVVAYVKSNEKLPPGVNLASVEKVGVRKPGEKSEDEE